MPESVDDELIYVTCSHCGKVTALGYGALTQSIPALCPHCSQPFSIDKHRAHEEALRKARELDAGPDALGSQD